MYFVGLEETINNKCDVFCIVAKIKRNKRISNKMPGTSKRIKLDKVK